jgi:hypothetical protein
MITIYLILSTIIFGILFAIWTNKGFVNMIARIFLLAGLVCGVLATLFRLGYLG